MGYEDCFHLGVKGLIQKTDGRLLLLQKNNKKPQEKPRWDLPGGRIHRKESLEKALKREVYEETGLSNITQIDPVIMVLSNIRIPLQDNDVGLILAIYRCYLLDDSPQIQLSDEHLQSIWVIPSEAAELLALNHPDELTQRIGRLPLNV